MTTIPVVNSANINNMEVEQQRVDEHMSICVIAIGMAGSGKTTFIGVPLHTTSEIPGVPVPIYEHIRHQFGSSSQGDTVQTGARHP